MTSQCQVTEVAVSAEMATLENSEGGANQAIATLRGRCDRLALWSGRVFSSGVFVRPAPWPLLLVVVLGTAGFGCSKKPEPEPRAEAPNPAAARADSQENSNPSEQAAQNVAAKKEQAKPEQLPGPGATEPAQLGAAAPDFTLPDLEGSSVSLSQHRGKTVVLEWFNPGCPFVQKSHAVGSLKGLASKQSADSVVWLAINSSAPGKQGHGVETNKKAVQEFGISYPVLLDEDGSVGKRYGAERTPHLYVIDPSGKLVYKGAIDNSPDGENKSPAGGSLVNHVADALSDVASGAPVRTPETTAYGCTIKYAG